MKNRKPLGEMLALSTDNTIRVHIQCRHIINKTLNRINKKIIGYHLKKKSSPLPMGRWYKNYMLTQVCSVFRSISFPVYFFHLGRQ
jgi:hypothetical protein